MANEDWLMWYHTLGLQPGKQDWAAVKKRYRFLIKASHPDRFTADDPQRVHAEERSKNITAAYQGLSHYYRRFGVLPGAESCEETFVEPALTPSPPTAAMKATSTRQSTRKPTPFWWRGVSAMLVLAVVYGVVVYVINTEEEAAKNTASVSATGNTATPLSDPFTYGDTLGMVYAAQGVPTRIEGDLWFYGLSEVQFHDGHVVSWNEHPNYPLNVKITSEPTSATTPSTTPQN